MAYSLDHCNYNTGFFLLILKKLEAILKNKHFLFSSLGPILPSLHTVGSDNQGSCFN